jgi:hypothetical protein
MAQGERCKLTMQGHIPSAVSPRQQKRGLCCEVLPPDRSSEATTRRMWPYSPVKACIAPSNQGAS